ncbi:alpha-D-ribose 1-methylphosphonate 5-triphosphate synthase subunit PhnG [Albimonas donghaensis]|uniref:Alpha-D-ribose 1-methylphosphonate 5-triphosphate synthase subunit PhnG n=1 Tax=Albimonas donghaensis TaxID=356660 RepID=A0A1H2THZ0_9RHOB|nr:phosphonate C-P lyase system protein PhnG [Albimonas donghaensis]SDW42894.1 alpha-D-ribose 1-methylphosphonate 5-triphosphate synthase subunit PhnG [Albimonas donghaensis]
MNDPDAPPSPEIEARKAWMSLLAKAPEARLEALWSAAGLAPEHAWLRPPEAGAVMLRGRAGAVGAPFNLGEMTATRCALRLACGTVGHAMVQGRGKEKARIAALCDALMRTEAAPTVRAAILDPLAQEAEARAAARAARAAATRVEFFTMVRGENA